MIITREQLKVIAPAILPKTSDGMIFWINEFSGKYEINTAVRMAAFLAQAAHETGEFTKFRENTNYSTAKRLMEIFPKYFPDLKTATPYVGKPIMVGSRVYANRMGNGDEKSGEGYKYRGGGIFQTTGKSNYRQVSLEIYKDESVLLNNPEMITTATVAVQSAMIYWDKNDLNDLADSGDFKGITKRINGGYNGLEDRLKYWEKAKTALGVKKDAEK